ncbi:MAG: hypothetical protein ABFS42_12090 [Candidatus Krumholzibacteriota bacterium]
MSHPLINPVHKFYIPVMGTGFTIDTPVKVARYGISSVISLVDDTLIEQMRKRLSGKSGREYVEIPDSDEDSRASRITSYLNMMDEMIEGQMEKLRGSLFEAGSEITRYFEMLPESPLKSMYDKMQTVRDPAERARLQKQLRERIISGAIDVNIMTKLDRDRMSKGQLLPPVFSDAMSALRGYANSRVKSSLILSAGMNRRLFNYLTEFTDFFPDDTGEIRKRIILKVGDFRSALVQGKLLARKGLWVSEYRIESGLNCGGHAFGGKGTLLGPVLEEFAQKREGLAEQLGEIWAASMQEMGRAIPEAKMDFRVTVQGGIGTSEETRMLEEEYKVDGTGWGSPFLLVPEVINIDESHLEKISVAREDDVHLSDSSPLGVPFWCLKTSLSEETRLERIAEGHPGSECPKGFLVSNTEFTKVPICTASRAYQRRKLISLGGDPDLLPDLAEDVVIKACICHDLAGSATVPNEIDPAAKTAVCCGPNTVYFSRVAKLREMVDHIYGRASLPLNSERPHMFLKEISLHLDRLKRDIDRRRKGLVEVKNMPSEEIRTNLMKGIRQYRDLASQMASDSKDAFLSKLDSLRGDLDKIKD